MIIQIPLWFYGFDSLLTGIAALIGFFVSYYAFKLFDMSSKRPHFYLYGGFVLLSMGLIVFSLINAYIYFNFVMFNQLTKFDTAVWVDDFTVWIYYISSSLAYLAFVMMYLPERRKFLPILFLPAWYRAFPYFHVSSFFLLSFVIFRTITNYFMKKSLNSFLVLIAFLFMGLFHVLLLLTPFNELIYVIAHLFLITGFISLLIMLIRVNRSESAKI